MNFKKYSYILTIVVASFLFFANDSAEASSSHTVKTGETIESIAKAYDLTVNELVDYNKLTSAKVAQAQVIRIPSHANFEKAKQLRHEAEKKAKESQYKTFSVTSTAYTANCTGCSGRTKTGFNLRANPNAKIIAVDPRVIPLGSKVWVEGYGTAIAADIGGAIKGNKIDVFMPTTKKAYAWGRKKVTIKVYKS